MSHLSVPSSSNAIASYSFQQTLEAISTNSPLPGQETSIETADLSGEFAMSTYPEISLPERSRLIGVALATNTTLTRLDLSRNGFGRIPPAPGEVLVPGSGMVDPRNPLNCCISPEITKHLPGHPSITSLNLSRNMLMNHPLAVALFAGPKLQSLDLSNNSLTKRAVAEIGAFLTNHPSLTHLDLSGNSVGDRGARSLSHALSLNSTLTSLNLRETRIGQVDLAQLETSLQSNSTLRHLVLSPQRGVSDGRNFEISMITSELTDPFSYVYRTDPMRRIEDQDRLTQMQHTLPSIPELYRSIREITVANERRFEQTMSLQGRSFRALVRPVYEQLDEGRKDSVEYQTWLNFNSPEDGDFHFGKNNVFTSFETFVDSVKGAGVDMAAEMTGFYSQPINNPKGLNLNILQDWAEATFKK